MKTLCQAFLFLATGFTPALAQSYTFTTFAGSPTNLGSADGTGSAARFSSPSGVAIDRAGNLIVVDNRNHDSPRHTCRRGLHACRERRAGWQ